MNDSIFDKLTRQLEKIPIEGIVDSAADKQNDYIIELNIAQLSVGKRADGSKINPKYKPRTIKYKEKKGQRSDVVTLQDEHDFVNAFKIRNQYRQKDIYSTDEKNDELVKKYKEEIFGLTDGNLNRVRKKMLPLMINNTRKFISKFRK